MTLTGQPDYQGAKRYALARLENDLPSLLSYHSIEHTRDDVVLAADRLAQLEGITGDDLMLLRTAALFHDVGYVEQRANHEQISERIAREVLPGFGYSDEQIQTISGLIRATIMPQCPANSLEAVLADADLDVLGRLDFPDKNARLRAEHEADGHEVTDAVWYRSQLSFLEGHRYFTSSAQSLRAEGKRRNIELLMQLLDTCR